MAVYAASDTSNFIWVCLFPFQASPAKGMEAIEYFGVDKCFSADCTGGIEAVELSEVTYGGVTRWGRGSAKSQGR